MDCKHFWNPIRTWGGRYKCRRCGAIGYRLAVVKDYPVKSGGAILPYKCNKQGCSLLATNRYKGRNYCREHFKR